MADDGADTGETAQRAAAAGTGALIGLAVGGPVGAIVGAASGPFVEPLMARVWDEVRADSRARAGAVVVAATDSLGVPTAEVERRMTATEQNRLLAATAMDAGMRTAWHPKIRALGRTLANGLIDDAEVDEEQLIVGALADLEAPHGRVLDLLITKKCEYAHGSGSSPGPRWRASNLSDREKPPLRYPGWESEQIAAVLSKLSGAVPTVLGTMHRHGLVVPKYDLSEVIGNLVTENSDGTYEIDTSGPDEPTVLWTATPLGLQLHQLLRLSQDDTEQV